MKAQKDILIYVIVITGLSVTVMASVIWFTALNITGWFIPELLLALGSVSIGALSPSLAPSPTNG